MNQDDRKQVERIRAEIEGLKAEVESLGAELRDLADAEQEKFDNMPEGLQQGEGGQAIELAASLLDEAARRTDGGGCLESLARGALDSRGV